MYMNKARLRAYAAALYRSVTPNSVVLDIGCGTGIFALLACKYGARRVYAVDPDDAINLARVFAAVNGYSDRLKCIQNVSTKITLPERVDVIISDLSGQLPLFEHHIPAMVDARDRFPAPDGILIAQQDHLRVAVVEAKADYRKLTRPWSESLLGLDLRGGRPLVTNTWRSLTDKRARFLTQPETFAVLDYRAVVDCNMCGHVNFTVDRLGTGHGVAVWFDRVLADGIKISTEPGAPESVNVASVYGTAFLPWPDSLELEPGDMIAFRIMANLVKHEYVWQWETTIHRSERKHDIKARFRQSSLQGLPFSLESLKKREAEYIPTPNENTRLNAFILSKIDGHASLMQIARSVVAAFPLRFKGWQDALSHVGDVIDGER
jgi:type I protein arginine methyltransferase